jgi:predicted metal-dependent HD superfamily phosphohydrolase
MRRRLRARWEHLWQKLHTETVPQEIFGKLVEAYTSPDRFYHNLTHIEDCLFLFDQTQSLALHPEEVELAIWFHDVIYDSRRDDNEERSAEWVRKVIRQAGLPGDIDGRVSQAILATRHTLEVTDPDAQLMVDVDLSILGREQDEFWQYEENIRKEYAWVPDPLFRRRRIEILSRFLERPQLYYHQQFKARFEERARDNLRRAIARLSGGAEA